MPRYSLQGIDKETGEARQAMISAADEESAVYEAGFMVEKVELAPEGRVAQVATATKRSYSTRALVITAAICCVLGYFAGREHVKYQIRSALTGAVEAFKQGFNDAFSSTEEPAQGVASSEDQSDFSILDISTRVTESNRQWSKYSWLMIIQNDGNYPIVLDATVEWLDDAGFVVDDDRAYGLVVPANASETFRGYALIRAGPARTVASVSAKAGIR